MGQNFLLEPSLARQIVSIAEVGPLDLIVEVGAGLGALTLPLAQRAKKVWALEADPALARVLKVELNLPENLEVVLVDALEFPYHQIAKSHQEKIKVVGNLPYQISSPLLFNLLEAREDISLMVFMFQKEVAQRLLASPGEKDYGPLAILPRMYCQVSMVKIISARHFYPRPKVDAALVKLVPLKEVRVKVKSELAFTRLVRAAFAYRRKTLENALITSGLFCLRPGQIREVIAGLAWPANRRAEELTLEEFGLLADALEELPARFSAGGPALVSKGDESISPLKRKEKKVARAS